MCSRAPRAALVDRQTTFGDAFFLKTRPFPSRLTESTVGLAVMYEKPSGTPAQFLGLGVAFDRAAVVSLPMAGDPSGERIRRLDDMVDEDGTISARAVVVPFGELYTGTDGIDFLGSRCRFRFLQADGSQIAVVTCTQHEAEETLRLAKAPIVARHRRRGSTPIRKGWESSAAMLPAKVASSDWQSWITEEVRARHAAEGGGTAHDLALFTTAATPAELVKRAEVALEPHLASHVRDSYRLFVLGEDPKEWDDIRPEIAGRQVLALLEAAGHDNASVAFSSVLIDRAGDVSATSLIVADGDREIVIGGYYSLHTALLAAEVLLPSWLAASS